MTFSQFRYLDQLLLEESGFDQFFFFFIFIFYLRHFWSKKHNIVLPNDIGNDTHKENQKKMLTKKREIETNDRTIERKKETKKREILILKMCLCE